MPFYTNLHFFFLQFTIQMIPKNLLERWLKIFSHQQLPQTRNKLKPVVEQNQKQKQMKLRKKNKQPYLCHYKMYSKIHPSALFHAQDAQNPTQSKILSVWISSAKQCSFYAVNVLGGLEEKQQHPPNLINSRFPEFYEGWI